MGLLARCEDSICGFVFQEYCYDLITNFVNHSKDISKTTDVTGANNGEVGVQMFSDSSPRVAIGCFAFVVSAVSSLKAWSAKFFKFARVG